MPLRRLDLHALRLPVSPSRIPFAHPCFCALPRSILPTPISKRPIVIRLDLSSGYDALAAACTELTRSPGSTGNHKIPNPAPERRRVVSANLSLSRCEFVAFTLRICHFHAAALSRLRCQAVTSTLRICHVPAVDFSRSRRGFVTLTLRMCHVHAADLSRSRCEFVTFTLPIYTFTLRFCHVHAANLSPSRCEFVTFTLRIRHFHAAARRHGGPQRWRSESHF